MKKDMLDELMKTTLHGYADGLTGDETLDRRVQQGLCAKVRRPARTRRIAVLAVAAALCLAFTGALASGKVTGLASSLSLSITRTSVEALRADTAQIAENITLPDALGEYRFKNGAVEQTRKLTDDGSTVGTFPELMAWYEKDGAMIWLSAHTYQSDIDADAQFVNPVETREIGGVSFTYSDDPYLFVSVDYELTDEQRAAMDEGTLVVSVGLSGSNTCQYEQFRHIEWTQDDVIYSIGGMDAPLTADEAFEMAAAAAGVA